MRAPLGMRTAAADVAVRLGGFSERPPSSGPECIKKRTPPFRSLSRLILCKSFFCNIHRCVVGGKSVRVGAAKVARIKREPPSTSGVFPEELPSRCVVSASVSGNASVGLKSARPDETSPRLVSTP
jgi:hypothetical protein